MTQATTSKPSETAAGEQYRWVYLWHWPIRAMHWVAAGAIVVLVITGLFIAKPYFWTGGEANPRFVMGWMRFAHFAAAAAFVATAIVRIYWLFAGNKFERFTALFPVKPKDWVNMFRLMKKYMMIHPERGPHYLGHNPMQQLSYTGIYIAAGLEVLTGFILYGVHNPGGFFDGVFGWMTPLMGGLQMVRFIHHALMWAFVIFLPIHVYLGVRSDVMDREGTMSSIFSGGRFVRSDAHFEDE